MSIQRIEREYKNLIDYSSQGIDSDLTALYAIRAIVQSGEFGKGMKLELIRRIAQSRISNIDSPDPLSKYGRSGMTDINGVEILEGSIINADGFKSDLEKHQFHCVVFEDGVFGSDIYSDFEPLSRYNKIEVVGHAEDYRKVYEGSRHIDSYEDEDNQWSGNLGEALK